MATQKLDQFNSCLLLTFGALQFLATPVFFKHPEEPAFWFFGGGITLILLGLINLLRLGYAQTVGPLRQVSIIANAMVLTFWLAMVCTLTYKFVRYPFAALPVVVLAAALVLSLVNKLPNE